MGQTVAALRRVRPDRFAAFLGDLSAALGDGAEVDCSPPSPEGSVDAVLEDGRERRLLRACQYPEQKRVTAGEVRELAALRSAGGFDSALLLATTGVSQDARRAAIATGVEVRDGEESVSLAHEHGVSVPTPERSREGLPHRTADWPESLVEAADAVVSHVESAERFERRTARTSSAVDADFIPARGGPPVVKVRFGDEALWAYVRYGGRFRRVGVLTPGTATDDAIERLTRELDASIRRALAE